MTRRAASRRATSNADHEVTSANRRKAELLAADPAIHRYGDLQPGDGRDIYSVYMHREDCGGGFVAHLWPWDLEQRYRVTYGRHDPDALWSYTAPSGAKEVH